MRIFLALLLFLMAAVAACGSDETAEPTIAPAVAATPTAMPAPAAAPTALPTATPVNGPAPTEAPSPAATTVPEPTAAPATPTPAPTATAVPPPTAAPTPEPTAMPVPAAVATPVPGLPLPAAATGSAVLTRLGDDPTTLNPHQTIDVVSANYVIELFGGLLTIDQDLVIVPDLVERWSMSPDATQFAFYISPDVKFHDGRKATAHDVKWSWELAADQDSEVPAVARFLSDVAGFAEKKAGRADSITGVLPFDDHTLAVVTAAPALSLPARLTFVGTFTLNRNTVEGKPDWSAAPNGTGPFKLLEYVPGEALRLGRNDGYHLGPASLEEVRFILGADGDNALAMYSAGQIHVAGVTLEQADGLREESSPFNHHLTQGPPQFRTDYFAMNLDAAPFDDVNVRLAFNQAVERQTLQSEYLDGWAVAATGVLPPGFPGFNPDLPGYGYDPDEARHSVERSAYYGRLQDMPPIVLTYAGYNSEASKQTVQAVLEGWERELGVTFELRELARPDYLDAIISRDFQMAFTGWVADYPDPETFLDSLLHSGSAWNLSGYSSAKVDRLLEQSRVEQNPQTRTDFYREVEETMLSDAPSVPMWHPTGSYELINPALQGYQQFPMIIPRYRYARFGQ